MMLTFLDFEKPVAQLQAQIAELRAAQNGDTIDIGDELAKLEAKSAEAASLSVQLNNLKVALGHQESLLAEMRAGRDERGAAT